jgi:TonB family protein
VFTIVLALSAGAAILQQPPAVRAHGDLASWFGADDYPTDAWLAREEGSVRFIYEVTPEGRVNACSILQSSGSRGLDEGTCQIVTEQGRFTPARDAQGRAVADRLTATITWQLPDELPSASLVPDLAEYITAADYPAEALRQGQQGETEFALILSSEGQPTDCRITRSSGSQLLDDATCRAMVERARFVPARDEHRRPVRSGYFSSVRWRIAADGTGSAVPGQRLRLRARARANLASYVRDDDYPHRALWRSEQGTVTFVLHIAPSGRVSDCVVLISSNSPSLDEKTCQIMEIRARFRPATDIEGNPAADRVTARITWRLSR